VYLILLERKSILLFKFTISRSSTDTSKGPLFTGYQLKSLPAVPRQRLIQYPLFCYDHESDNLGVEVGYEGSAYDRLSQLEAVENLGDTVRVEDFRTGESYIGLIEELDFINKTLAIEDSPDMAECWLQLSDWYKNVY
jgi:hypothetical protein